MKRFTLKNLFTRSSAGNTLKERRRYPRPIGGYDFTILIVDDSRTVVTAFTRVLRQAGFKTLAATNGLEGVAMAKAHLPNLILMDVVMPGLNGFQATRQIRKNESTSHIPIIIVSGEQQATEQFWGRRVGANDFMTKPVNRGQFFEKIFTTLKQKTDA
ncbi:MAG TPA: response regulator [Gammaproteobacteria bacterium]|nr:response regulator [Gammaproteobacteria bacterium]